MSNVRNGENTIMDKIRIEKAVREILIGIGEDPDREGLIETPRRVAEMYEEIFAGLHKNPLDDVKKFHEDHDNGMIIVKDIPVYSMCEHHLLPFMGVAHVVYIPSGDEVLGLSKLARIVDTTAKKPQLQERLGNQIADVIMEAVDTKGVAVVIEAEHLCMTMRGIRKPGSKTITSALRGLMKTDAQIRMEALSLINGR